MPRSTLNSNFPIQAAFCGTVSCVSLDHPVLPSRALHVECTIVDSGRAGALRAWPQPSGLSEAVHGGCLLCPQPVDVFDESVMGDLPKFADLE